MYMCTPSMQQCAVQILFTYSGDGTGYHVVGELGRRVKYNVGFGKV